MISFLPKFPKFKELPQPKKFLKLKKRPKIKKLSRPKLRIEKRKAAFLALLVLISVIFGMLGGILVENYFLSGINDYFAQLNSKIPQPKITEKVVEEEKELGNESEEVREGGSLISQEEAVVEAVEKVSPAVVSIIITKELPVYEEKKKHYSFPEEFEEFFGESFQFEVPEYEQKGVQKKEVGGGSGFIISKDGMILTNRHVVLDKEAEYTVFTNDGRKFSAEVLARDPIQDIALIKIEDEKSFPVLKLGDSSQLKIGQTAIAIGNALGEFRNTVSIGVISGLGRTITASGGGLVETLEDTIQTDAAINRGNSGGPLLNLKGEAIGINTAMVLGAQSIGFAIPINKARKDVQQFKTSGKISYPFLGIYYTLITEELKEEFDLPVDYGVWVGRNENGEEIEEAIFPDSAAQKAGLKRDDIILEFDEEKITIENSLAKLIMEYNPGDRITLKILREGKRKTISVTLGERSE